MFDISNTHKHYKRFDRTKRVRSMTQQYLLYALICFYRSKTKSALFDENAQLLLCHLIQNYSLFKSKLSHLDICLV